MKIQYEKEVQDLSTDFLEDGQGFESAAVAATKNCATLPTMGLSKTIKGSRAP